MEYWPHTRWKIAITGQSPDRWIEPDLPYALIGSHPCCTVRINEPRVSPFVYFACCFADSVEVWPLSPIAYPRWGATLPEHTLAIGKKRLSLFHESHAVWQDVSEEANTPERANTKFTSADGVRRQITLDWDGKQRPKMLARRVMILGCEHPSTLRLYGQGLAPCDHAIVCVGSAVWLINLNPSPEESDPASYCKRLTSMSPPVTAGNIKLRLGKTIEPKQTRENTAEFPTSHLLPNKASKTSLQTKVSEIERAVQPNRQPGWRGLRANNSLKRKKNKARSTPESLTSDLTNRLVEIDQAKFTRRRILFIATIVTGFLIALVIVLAIVFLLLIPKITEMMGE